LHSVIHRFIKIGTLLRRLDRVVESFRSARSSPTHHAFAHSLGCRAGPHSKVPYKTTAYQIFLSLSGLALLYRHRGVTVCSWWTMLRGASHSSKNFFLSAEILTGYSKTPPYDPLPSTAASLLSHIYKHLSLHVDLSSPQPIRATIAFIFSTTSDFFLHSIDRSIGIGKPHLPLPPKRRDLLLTRTTTSKKEWKTNELFEDNEEEEWPDFFPPTLSERLPKAKKSLKVLFAAAPEHPLLTDNIARRHCKWVWDEEGLERVHEGEWDCGHGHGSKLRPSTPPPELLSLST
jgi:hypothetical protein